MRDLQRPFLHPKTLNLIILSYVIIVTAIENCRPVMQLEKVKVGSVTYHVPTPITDSRFAPMQSSILT